MRIVIAVRRPGSPICEYVSKRGFRTPTCGNAYIFTTVSDAKAELEYRRKTTSGYRFTMERLASGSGVHAFTRAVELPEDE